jgi:hypothetical protein
VFNGQEYFIGEKINNEMYAGGGEIKSMYIETFGEELEEDVSDDMARQILIEHYDNTFQMIWLVRY